MIATRHTARGFNPGGYRPGVLLPLDHLPGAAIVIVCVCRRVSERDIHRAVHDGALSFDDLQIDLGVATACGSCLDCAQRTWADACTRVRGTVTAESAGERLAVCA